LHRKKILILIKNLNYISTTSCILTLCYVHIMYNTTLLTNYSVEQNSSLNINQSSKQLNFITPSVAQLLLLLLIVHRVQW